MKAMVEMDVTRELILSLLRAYARQALPSAMLGVLAQALRESDSSVKNDGDWQDYVALRLTEMKSGLLDTEMRIHLGPECEHKNREQVTLAEWLAAAGVDWKGCHLQSRLFFIEAWERGEDPTEHA